MVIRAERLTPSRDTRSQTSCHLRFEVLLGAHVVGEPVEASLVSMALAALNGIQRNGQPMQGSGGPATAREIARELGWRTVDAVNRGLRFLREKGVVEHAEAGWSVVAAVYGSRNGDNSRWLMLDKNARRRGLTRSPALFIVSLALGQIDYRNGRAVLGRPRVRDLTGWSWSRIDRATRSAVEAGALRRWNLPGRGLPCYVPGEPVSESTNESPRAHSESTNESGGRTRSESTNRTQRIDEPRAVNRRPARSQSTNAFRTRRDQDHQEAAGGGGSPSESRQNLVEITLGQIGYRGEQCADAAQDILAKRGDRALEWTVKQIEDIRRDPAVKNVAGVLAKRLSLGLHDPANDPPPSARDHDAGAGIRGENMQQLREQQQADPVYQARKIRGLLSDGRQPQEVADICGVPVSEVYAVTHGSAQKPAPSVQRSGIEGVLELVKQRPSAAQAATA